MDRRENVFTGSTTLVLCVYMVLADLTLSAPETISLHLLPPRCKIGAHVELFVYGVTTMEGNNILRSHNIWVVGTINSNLGKIDCAGKAHRLSYFGQVYSLRTIGRWLARENTKILSTVTPFHYYVIV